MSYNYRILILFLFIPVISSCKKTDNTSVPGTQEMKDLKISPNFNWETSRNNFRAYNSGQSDHLFLLIENQFFRNHFPLNNIFLDRIPDFVFRYILGCC